MSICRNKKNYFKRK